MRPRVARRAPSIRSRADQSYGTSAAGSAFPGEEGREGPGRRATLATSGSHGYRGGKAGSSAARRGRRGSLEIYSDVASCRAVTHGADRNAE